MTHDLYVASIIPISALYDFSLWFANFAYIYLSVSFIQMLKALMSVTIYSIGILFKKDTFKIKTLLNMLSISFDVVIVAYGEARFNAWGIMLQLIIIDFEATRLILIQILLTSKGISLNPITSLYDVSPCCLVFLLLIMCLVKLLVLCAASSSHPDLLVYDTNSSCTFTLNLAIFLLIGKTSALTMNITGVVKD